MYGTHDPVLGVFVEITIEFKKMLYSKVSKGDNFLISKTKLNRYRIAF